MINKSLTRKAAGFKSLRLNCSNITQVIFFKPPPLIFSWEIQKFFKTVEAANRGVLQKKGCNVIKIPQHRCFTPNIAKLLRTHTLKNICYSGTLIFQNNFFICFNPNPSNMVKNVFYFILKALFVLTIFKFLS